jgi:hypothetical protein
LFIRADLGGDDGFRCPPPSQAVHLPKRIGHGRPARARHAGDHQDSTGAGRRAIGQPGDRVEHLSAFEEVGSRGGHLPS